MVYYFGGGKYGDEDPDPMPYFLAEGDFQNTRVVDKTPDGGRLIVAKNTGRPMALDNIPTVVSRGGPSLEKVPLLDVNSVYSGTMVNQTFKDILEELEPSVHQFFPMAVMNKGEKIADHYWLNICNRLDAIDKTKTYPLDDRGFWNPKRGEPSAIVFSLDAIGDRHIWHDKFVEGTFVSEEFLKRLREAGLTGLSYGAAEVA